MTHKTKMQIIACELFQITIYKGDSHTAWKVSVFGIILVRIFPHLDWTRRDSIWAHAVQMRENTDQNNSEYGHFTQCQSNDLLWWYNQSYPFQRNELIALQFCSHDLFWVAVTVTVIFHLSRFMFYELLLVSTGNEKR